MGGGPTDKEDKFAADELAVIPHFFFALFFSFRLSRLIEVLLTVL
jgi:hypothetical protein